MRVKDRVLSHLLNHPGEVFSGQIIADQLEVSRNAVWKAINELRSEGYDIESIHQKGYQLKQASTQLDDAQIKLDLPETWNHLTVEIFDEVTSTNDLAKQFITDKTNDSALFVSTKQTKGRGRQGRPFYSELDLGLYFSLVVQPKNIAPYEIPMYTIAAATALMQAMEDVFDIEPRIKWVNDLFYRGRKISGILSEATTNLEDGAISSVVIGIGTNIAGSFEQTDADVSNVAGTIFDEIPADLNLNKYLNRFLHHFATYHEDLSSKSFLPIYESHLLGLGQEVTYTDRGIKREGVIEGIDDQGHLLVRKRDGVLQVLLGQDIHFSSKQFVNLEGEKNESKRN